jgi:hypothetical protein
MLLLRQSSSLTTGAAAARRRPLRGMAARAALSTAALTEEAARKFLPDDARLHFSATTGGVNNLVYYVHLDGSDKPAYVVRVYNNGENRPRVVFEHLVLDQLNKRPMSFKARAHRCRRRRRRRSCCVRVSMPPPQLLLCGMRMCVPALPSHPHAPTSTTQNNRCRARCPPAPTAAPSRRCPAAPRRRCSSSSPARCPS